MLSLWKYTSCFVVLVVPVANHTIAVAGSSLPKVCGKKGHYCGKIDNCSSEMVDYAAIQGPEHTGHFVQPHVAAHCGGPEHTRATCGGHMYVMYANALSVAWTSHSLSHT